MNTTESIQARATRLVAQEVHCCLSSIVGTLAGGCAVHTHGDKTLRSLFDQAFELASPVADYEEAARKAGWKTADMTPGMLVNDQHRGDDGLALACYGSDAGEYDWAEACRALDIEPYDREVFEHWAVSGWLADQLIAKGEKVDKDFGGLCVWARTTTGQGIAVDSVIEAIAADLLKPEPTP